MDKLRSFLKTQPFGYKKRFARAIGRDPSYFSQQLAGKRAFTETDAINIEKESGGVVRCEDIVPTADWEFVRASAKPQIQQHG